jgi:hypothetical protein
VRVSGSVALWRRGFSIPGAPGAWHAARRDGSASVGGGTAWLWSRPDAFEAVDVLFVDKTS